MRKKLQSLIPLLLLLIIPAKTSAGDTTTPIISSVSGTVATGQTLVISGANMVNENTADWATFFQNYPNASGFEGSSPAADGYGHVTGSTYNPIYDTSVKLMGNQSVKYHVQGTANIHSPVTSYLYTGHNLRGQNDIWIRWYSRFNLISGKWPTVYMKELYAMNAGLYLGNPGRGTSTPPTAFGVKSGKASHVTSTLPNGLLRNNVWYCVEVHWNNTNNNPVMEVYVDGVSIYKNSIPATGNLSPILMGIINYFSADPDMSLDHWWDDFAISSSRIYEASKVEISDSPTYGQGTINHQEPVYLSDGSISIKADLSGLSGSNYYLWITNNQQQRSMAYSLLGRDGVH